MLVLRVSAFLLQMWRHFVFVTTDGKSKHALKQRDEAITRSRIDLCHQNIHCSVVHSSQKQLVPTLPAGIADECEEWGCLKKHGETPPLNSAG